MYSIVGICNTALGRLGANQITAMTDDTVEAKLCSQHYASSRDAVLEARNWTFAIRRRELAASLTSPTYGYDYQFELPGDCIRIISVSDNGYDLSLVEWAKEGRNILANVETLYVKYIKRETDPTVFSPNFVQALTLHLASILAIPLTGSAEVLGSMEQLYQQALASAGAYDSMQGRRQNIITTRLSSARAGRM